MRSIDTIIIHCTATPENREVTIDEIRTWHKQRGFSDIGYHYVVGLDGSVHVGRPESEVGAHCLGKNENSIGIAYVGGLSVDGKTPKDTRTTAQIVALERIIIDTCSRLDIKEIAGHSKYANKACPCFDVESEYYRLLP